LGGVEVFGDRYAERAAAAVVGAAADRLDVLAATHDQRFRHVDWEGPRAERLRAEGRTVSATLRREAGRLRAVATVLRGGA
jgi:hypothetical protein